MAKIKRFKNGDTCPCCGQVIRGLTDEQLDQYAQMAVDQMGLDLDAIEGDYVDENGTLKLADNDPVPYVLTGTTLEFTVEEFGDLKFDRVG